MDEILFVILLLLNVVAIGAISMFIYYNSQDIQELQDNVKTLTNADTSTSYETRITKIENSITNIDNNKTYVVTKMSKIQTEMTLLNIEFSNALNKYKIAITGSTSGTVPTPAQIQKKHNLLFANSNATSKSDYIIDATGAYTLGTASGEIIATDLPNKETQVLLEKNPGSTEATNTTLTRTNIRKQPISGQASHLHIVNEINAIYADITALFREAKMLNDIATGKDYQADVVSAWTVINSTYTSIKSAYDKYMKENVEEIPTVTPAA